MQLGRWALYTIQAPPAMRSRDSLRLGNTRTEDAMGTPIRGVASAAMRKPAGCANAPRDIQSILTLPGYGMW
jgi:hypothetical protein